MEKPRMEQCIFLWSAIANRIACRTHTYCFAEKKEYSYGKHVFLQRQSQQRNSLDLPAESTKKLSCRKLKGNEQSRNKKIGITGIHMIVKTLTIVSMEKMYYSDLRKKGASLCTYQR
ncbi:hypothetical protein [Propionispira raffinosivorans]|uniref:hypothetical protein n=1 Tax=Propionispira raffinosivorans TaxID=86959 RepID=UPI000362363E|nr:hypothetical protein [Propionispira raffinosivorans]